MSTANEPGRAMGNSPPWAALLLFAIAVDLAAPWLCVDPSRDLHGDEALYAYYGGRMAFDHDWYIRRGFEPVVKPPLLPAAIGVSLAVLGGTRAAEQLPNRVLGIAGTIAAFGLAASLGGPTAGWFAALLVTTSTRWRFYACSSFTDLGMVAMLLAGAWSLAAGRWRLAGALATASFGFKQFGLLAMAYGLALAMVLDVARPGTGRRFGRSRNWMVGSALVGLPVLWWCSQTAPRWGPFVAGGHPFSSPVALSVETGGFFSRLRFWVAAFLEASPLPGWLTLAAAGFGLRDARVRPGLAGSVWASAGTCW